jgi:hypothetical protein
LNTYFRFQVCIHESKSSPQKSPSPGREGMGVSDFVQWVCPVPSTVPGTQRMLKIVKEWGVSEWMSERVSGQMEWVSKALTSNDHS